MSKAGRGERIFRGKDPLESPGVRDPDLRSHFGGTSQTYLPTSSRGRSEEGFQDLDGGEGVPTTVDIKLLRSRHEPRETVRVLRYPEKNLISVFYFMDPNGFLGLRTFL